MDGPVIDTEQLANYIVESNKFRANNEVHHRAFLPGPDGERSVFRIDDLSSDAIIALGQAEVGAKRQKPILGWAQLKASDARETRQLKVEAAEPPNRHAVICNWPESSEKRLALAMMLASKSIGIRSS